MASHDVSWTPGAHVRFGSLDFLTTVEGGLVRAPALVQPPRSASLDTAIEALEKLQLHAPEAQATGATSFSTSTTRGWNTSSQSSWDPSHPRTYVTFLSSTNDTT
jgi:hypothetical protein